MNPVDLFSLATKIETPLMLAGLVVLVFFALFRGKVTDRQAKMLFVLALVAIIVGVSADLIRATIAPPVRYFVEGRVYAPPTDATAGIPRASVFFEMPKQGVQMRCTDEAGYFKFEIPSTAFGEKGVLWVTADRFQHSNEIPVNLQADAAPVKIGLSPITAVEPTTAATAAPAQQPSSHAAASVPKPQNATAVVMLSEAPMRAQLARIEPSCVAGDWHEQLPGRPDRPNSQKWHFALQRKTLRISRQDQFVHGVFNQVDNGWQGDLIWNNGQTWHNVFLTPSPDCRTITTNQAWSYKR